MVSGLFLFLRGAQVLQQEQFDSVLAQIRDVTDSMSIDQMSDLLGFLEFDLTLRQDIVQEIAEVNLAARWN